MAVGSLRDVPRTESRSSANEGTHDGVKLLDLGDVGDLLALVGGVGAGRRLTTAVRWISHQLAGRWQSGHVEAGTPDV